MEEKKGEQNFFGLSTVDRKLQNGLSRQNDRCTEFGCKVTGTF